MNLFGICCAVMLLHSLKRLCGRAPCSFALKHKMPFLSLAVFKTAKRKELFSHFSSVDKFVSEIKNLVAQQ